MPSRCAAAAAAACAVSAPMAPTAGAAAAVTAEEGSSHSRLSRRGHSNGSCCSAARWAAGSNRRWCSCCRAAARETCTGGGLNVQVSAFQLRRVHAAASLPPGLFSGRHLLQFKRPLREKLHALNAPRAGWCRPQHPPEHPPTVVHRSAVAAAVHEGRPEWSGPPGLHAESAPVLAVGGRRWRRLQGLPCRGRRPPAAAGGAADRAARWAWPSAATAAGPAAASRPPWAAQSASEQG